MFPCSPSPIPLTFRRLSYSEFRYAIIKRFIMANQDIRQSFSAKPRFFYGYIVVVAAFCIMVTAYGTRSAFGVFFKPMLTEFGWTRAMTSGAFSLSMAIEGLLAIIMGGLNKITSPYRCLHFRWSLVSSVIFQNPESSSFFLVTLRG